MSTLVETLTTLLYNQNIHNGAEAEGIAKVVLEIIADHPETLERRRRDFEAGYESGRYLGEDNCYNFETYLAAEKEQGK